MKGDSHISNQKRKYQEILQEPTNPIQAYNQIPN